jgi:RecA-family ATPase
VSPKPQSPRPIDPRTLPALEPLTRLPRWVCWRWVWVEGKGKWTKPPYQTSGRYAQNDNPKTWSDFDRVWSALEKFDGIGFNLKGLGSKELAAIDLDRVRDAETGKILPWAAKVAETSYCEITPSGAGLRVIGRAPGIASVHRKIRHPQGGDFELYANCARFITVSGQAFNGVDQLCDITKTITELGELGGIPTAVIDDDEAVTEIVVEDLPPAIADLITKGGENGALPEHRGTAFMKVVGHLQRGGHSYGSVLALLKSYPEGVQSKYLDERRLEKELKRVWDKIPAERPAPLRILNPRDWAGLPIPERRWIVPDWIPRGVVTSLYGPPGIGKSLLAQQLMTATALERPWLGMAVEPMRSLGVFCEDDDDELHRRQAAINRQLHGCDFADLGGMLLLPRLGEDNILMRFTRDGRGEPTGFFDQLAEAAQDQRIELIVIDTIADTFGGNQNDAGQVRQFVQFGLARLARIIGGAVLACAHPSRAGQNSGTGESGSVQWDATVRSRLYLALPGKEDDEQPADPDVRVLTRKKANYAARDDAVDLSWSNGVFKTATGSEVARPDAETVFLTLLDQMSVEGQVLSHKVKAGNYAPRMFKSRSGRSGYRIDDFTRAMQELLKRREIAIVEYKTPERKTGERIQRYGGRTDEF